MSALPGLPRVIINMPDRYSNGAKWKDRFMTTAHTAAQGLVRYLVWPGDRVGYAPIGGHVGGEVGLSKHAMAHGEIGVYVLDEAATAKLRAELVTMDPDKRWSSTRKGRYGQPAPDLEFQRGVAEAVRRSTGML